MKAAIIVLGLSAMGMAAPIDATFEPRADAVNPLASDDSTMIWGRPVRRADAVDPTASDDSTMIWGRPS
ncbi:hypothetical protein N0V82_001409 [Gnomoniopsis sp. IMI 355080]|nr:hypothetical protein N0V82_001409 [Gnomoniopsis sp. IMI 355080]